MVTAEVNELSPGYREAGQLNDPYIHYLPSASRTRTCTILPASIFSTAKATSAALRFHFSGASLLCPLKTIGLVDRQYFLRRARRFGQLYCASTFFAKSQ